MGSADRGSDRQAQPLGPLGAGAIRSLRATTPSSSAWLRRLRETDTLVARRLENLPAIVLLSRHDLPDSRVGPTSEVACAGVSGAGALPCFAPTRQGPGGAAG